MPFLLKLVPALLLAGVVTAVPLFPIGSGPKVGGLCDKTQVGEILCSADGSAILQCQSSVNAPAVDKWDIIENCATSHALFGIGQGTCNMDNGHARCGFGGITTGPIHTRDEAVTGGNDVIPAGGVNPGQPCFQTQLGEVRCSVDASSILSCQSYGQAPKLDEWIIIENCTNIHALGPGPCNMIGDTTRCGLSFPLGPGPPTTNGPPVTTGPVKTRDETGTDNGNDVYWARDVASADNGDDVYWARDVTSAENTGDVYWARDDASAENTGDVYWAREKTSADNTGDVYWAKKTRDDDATDGSDDVYWARSEVTTDDGNDVYWDKKTRGEDAIDGGNDVYWAKKSEGATDGEGDVYWARN